MTQIGMQPYALDMSQFTPYNLGLESGGLSGGTFAPPMSEMGGGFDVMGTGYGVNAPGLGGWGNLNMTQKLGFGLQGLSTLGGLVMGLKQLSLANKQYQLQKKFGTANINNEVKTYNTALADRARARAFTESAAPGTADAYVAANKLTGV